MTDREKINRVHAFCLRLEEDAQHGVDSAQRVPDSEELAKARDTLRSARRAVAITDAARDGDEGAVAACLKVWDRMNEDPLWALVKIICEEGPAVDVAKKGEA